MNIDKITSIKSSYNRKLVKSYTHPINPVSFFMLLAEKILKYFLNTSNTFLF